MPSIELLLDAYADAAVRAEWDALADAGLPSQADHRGESNAPHVTAAYASGALAPMPVAPPRGPVLLGAPLLFPRRRGVVLVRALVVTAELLDWHRELHESLPAGTDVDPFTVPGAWTPHVTLARALPLSALPDALEALGRVGTARDLPLRFPSVRHWDSATRTVTDLTAPPTDRVPEAPGPAGVR